MEVDENDSQDVVFLVKKREAQDFFSCAPNPFSLVYCQSLGHIRATPTSTPIVPELGYVLLDLLLIEKSRIESAVYSVP